MNKLTSASMNAALVAGLGLLVQQPVIAAGFSLPEVSALGTATANALVANPEDKGAFPYNPAAMGFHDDSSLSLGTLFIGPNFNVRTGNGSFDSNSADWVVAPMIQAAIKINEQWRAGLGVNAPFGLETRWREGTFPALSGSTPRTIAPGVVVPIPNGNHPTQSKLEILDFVPAATYKVNGSFSVAAGLDLYWAKSAVLNSSLGELSGDGTGIGFNAGLLYRHDALSLGASYHSSATLGIEGPYSPLNTLLVVAGGLAPGQPAKVDLELPWRLQLGVRYEVSDELAVEFDWTRSGWSKFDKLTVKGQRTGEVIFTDTNAWDDANAYRIGMTYQLLPATQLRLGYAYDETGQQDDHFSARVPDNDRHLFGIGVGQDVGQGLSLEAGYMYVKFEDRDYRGSRQYLGLGDDINGSNAIDGDYAASAHLIGIEIRKTF
jgi:long-chain fatty acid transport protein